MAPIPLPALCMSRQALTPPQLFCLLAIFVGSTLFLGRILWPLFPCLFLALFMADTLRPAYAGLARFLPAVPASLLICLFVVLVLVVPVAFFVDVVSDNVCAPDWPGRGCVVSGGGASILSSPHWGRLPELAVSCGLPLGSETISAMGAELGQEVWRYVSSHAGGWVMGVSRLFIQFLVMIVTVFFVLIDRERFAGFWGRLSPLPAEQNRILVGQLKETARAVLIGNGVGSFIQGVVGGLLFIWLGLPSPLFWGFVMFVLAFLPIVGIGVIMLPAGIYLFLHGDISGLVLLGAVYLLLTVLVEYFLKARMTGGQAHMHPLVAFLALIGGLESFGMMGIVYGPLIVTCFTCLADFYLTDYLPVLQGRAGQGAAAGQVKPLPPPVGPDGGVVDSGPAAALPDQPRPLVAGCL